MLSTRSRAWGKSRFIFQLPAMIGVRMMLFLPYWFFRSFFSSSAMRDLMSRPTERTPLPAMMTTSLRQRASVRIALFSGDPGKA